MSINIAFPRLAARNLEGLDVVVPDAFIGERNVVMVAFHRKHQTLVDSWVPFLEAHVSTDSGLHFYELPTIGRLWAPVRNMIDGGMAAAIRDPVVLRRKLTIYGNIGRLTDPLGIVDRSTITLMIVDSNGIVRWRDAGGFESGTALRLETALQSG